MKDEAAGIPIVEFIGLQSKLYSCIKDNEKGSKTAEGVKKNVIKKDTLFKEKQMHHKMKTRSNLHELSNYDIKKISLSCFDDKRYMLADGHYRIPKC